LTEKGRELGLINDERWSFFERKRELIASETVRLNKIVVRPEHVTDSEAMELLGAPLQREAHADALLRRPEVSYDALTRVPVVDVPEWMKASDADDRLIEQIKLQIEVHAKYTGYIDRQQDEIERHQRYEKTQLPTDLDYVQVRGLSTEVRQRLQQVRPTTLGQAARVPGITPAAISLLLVHLKRQSAASRAARTGSI